MQIFYLGSMFSTVRWGKGRGLKRDLPDQDNYEHKNRQKLQTNI